MRWFVVICILSGKPVLKKRMKTDDINSAIPEFRVEEAIP